MPLRASSSRAAAAGPGSSRSGCAACNAGAPRNARAAFNSGAAGDAGAAASCDFNAHLAGTTAYAGGVRAGRMEHGGRVRIMRRSADEPSDLERNSSKTRQDSGERGARSRRLRPGCAEHADVKIKYWDAWGTELSSLVVRADVRGVLSERARRDQSHPLPFSCSCLRRPIHRRRCCSGLGQIDRLLSICFVLHPRVKSGFR